MANEISHAGTLRLQSIALLVESQSFVSVRELTERFDVSAVTIRSDLDRLEHEGRIRRVRGGAVPRDISRAEMPFEMARDRSAPAKARIARCAVDEIAVGDTVLLDVGTTTNAIASELVARTDLTDVTVFTNSLPIAYELERAAERIQVVVTGGTLRPLQHSLVEPLATVLLEGIHAHVAFVGCSGVHPIAAITNINLPETSVKQAMLRAARRRVIVADGSKFGEVDLVRVCSLDDVGLLITDDSADVDLVAELRSTGLEVLLV